MNLENTEIYQTQQLEDYQTEELTLPNNNEINNISLIIADANKFNMNDMLQINNQRNIQETELTFKMNTVNTKSGSNNTSALGSYQQEQLQNFIY